MLVRVSRVVKRSVLLSISIVSSLVLIGLREGPTRPPRGPSLFRTACQASSSPHLRGFSVLILIL